MQRLNVAVLTASPIIKEETMKNNVNNEGIEKIFYSHSVPESVNPESCAVIHERDFEHLIQTVCQHYRERLIERIDNDIPSLRTMIGCNRKDLIQIINEVVNG